MDKLFFFNNIIDKIYRRKRHLNKADMIIVLTSYIKDVRSQYNDNFIQSIVNMCFRNPMLSVATCMDIAISHFINKYGICSVTDRNGKLLFYYI